MNEKEMFLLMKKNGHKFDVCKKKCGTMIHCGFCGNNCCNEETGSYKKGVFVECPDGCKEAYEIQEFAWKNDLFPKGLKLLAKFYNLKNDLRFHYRNIRFSILHLIKSRVVINERKRRK